MPTMHFQVSKASARGLLRVSSGATEEALRTSEWLCWAVCSPKDLVANFARRVALQPEKINPAKIVPTPTDHGDEIFRVGAALKVDRVPGFDSVEYTLWAGWRARGGSCI